MSESNPINVFATHTFEESFDYLRVFEFLEGVDRFYYINVSKPENIPGSGGKWASEFVRIGQRQSRFGWKDIVEDYVPVAIP